jgi:hypothetical protein
MAANKVQTENKAVKESQHFWQRGIKWLQSRCHRTRLKSGLQEHTLNSLGYKNVITALDTVFSAGYSVTKSRQGPDDDFIFGIQLTDGKQFELAIGETNNIPMRGAGPGGLLTLYYLGPVWDHDPESSSYSLWDDGRQEYNLSNRLKDDPEGYDFLNHEGISGKKAENIAKSLQILKAYLDRHDNPYFYGPVTDPVDEPQSAQ